ncbi:hypothetical protein [Rhodanobacter thiooxydans]|uniref:hypothetical protein n=1 Tax=Rhodanobacter thiooxydans TaxID=416169 RepID=UPI0002DAB855|nr:hypothetical protein [Rhodanobacter thiooxydans]
MLIDVWKRFEGLLPSQTVTIATVAAINTDGTSSLTTPEGGTLRAIGTSVGVGANVYVQLGRILGPAPTLPTYNLTV